MRVGCAEIVLRCRLRKSCDDKGASAYCEQCKSPSNTAGEVMRGATRAHEPLKVWHGFSAGAISKDKLRAELSMLGERVQSNVVDAMHSLCYATLALPLSTSCHRRN